jgi:hypothetical protein
MTNLAPIFAPILVISGRESVQASEKTLGKWHFF